MKALVLLAVLWGMAGCVTGPPIPTEASDIPSADETLRLRERSIGSFIEKPWRFHRRGHISARGPRHAACDAAPGVGGQRASRRKGQRSTRS
jgi:hypothetical protein